MYSSFHLTHIYLICYVSGIVLGAKDTARNKTKLILAEMKHTNE